MLGIRKSYIKNLEKEIEKEREFIAEAHARIQKMYAEVGMREMELQKLEENVDSMETMLEELKNRVK